MKRVLSSLLLCLFLFSTAGYYLVFLALDSSNRNEIQHSLFHESSLVTIRFHKSEIKNIAFKDGGKEFSMNGEMYDIKKKSADGDYIVFYCKHDKKETKLLAEFDKHIKQNTDSKSSDKKDNSKNPVKDLFFSEKKNSLRTSAEFVFPFADCKLQTVNLPSPSLPPEVSPA